MDDEFTVSWEDATAWEVSRSQGAGCFDAGGGSPLRAGLLTARSPRRRGPATQRSRTWGTLEIEVGGPISGGRDRSEARCRARPGGACQDRPVGRAFGTARLHPAANWTDPLAPRGHAGPLAEHRPPEGAAWHQEKLLAGGQRPDRRP